MLFSNIALLTPGQPSREGMFVATKGGKIAAVGERRPEGNFGEEYDGRGKLLIPGLVNGHCHVPMTLVRGYGTGLPLQEWLNTYMFPYEDQIHPQDAYWGAMLGIAEMLRGGVASFSEQYMFADSICQAVVESGIKCNFSRSLVCFDDDTYLESDRRQEAIRNCETYQNAADGRLKVEFAAHGEYTTTEKCIRDIVELAHRYHTGVQIHLSETKKEHEECKGRHQGRTPTQYLRDCGFFDLPALAAHGVWLEEEDLEILAEKGVGIAYNPTSNMKLGSGFAPVRRMLDKGICVGLGTDGAGSNNNLNMLEEAHLGLLIQSGHTGNCQELTAEEMLAMATVHGARNQRREDCGRVEEGFRADLAVLDLDRPHLTPLHDLTNQLFYAAQASDVVLTMVDGRVLYRDGRLTTIDLERVLYEARRANWDVLARLAAARQQG